MIWGENPLFSETTPFITKASGASKRCQVDPASPLIHTSPSTWRWIPGTMPDRSFQKTSGKYLVYVNAMEYLGVSENSGIPKSSILIRFSIINHPFWGYPYFWKHPCQCNGIFSCYVFTCIIVFVCKVNIIRI